MAEVYISKKKYVLPIVASSGVCTYIPVEVTLEQTVLDDGDTRINLVSVTTREPYGEA